MVLPKDFHHDYDMVQMVHLFRTAFKIPFLRSEVLSEKYEQKRLNQNNFSAGFCGIASYTWNHLFRMPDGSEIWRLKMTTKEKDKIGNHVWLENVFNGEPFDLTFDQFVDSAGTYLEFPYDKFGTYANSDFVFQRAYNFANYIGLDLSSIVLENSLRSLGRR